MGTIVWAADYLPFGQVEITVDTIENNLRFAGQIFDPETGLHYNYHRYYDPATGRYLTTDPIGLEGGINPYVYVQNNPANLLDPFGLESIRDPATGQIVTIPDVQYKDLYKIEQHWQRIREGQENVSRRDQAPEYDMLKRLKKGEITKNDFEFYMHEIIEKDIIEQNYNNQYSYENLKKAHDEALKKRGVTDYDLWHPDIRRKYREKGIFGPYFDEKCE